MAHNETAVKPIIGRPSADAGPIRQKHDDRRVEIPFRNDLGLV